MSRDPALADLSKRLRSSSRDGGKLVSTHISFLNSE
jgi:hypothetical protein